MTSHTMQIDPDFFAAVARTPFAKELTSLPVHAHTNVSDRYVFLDSRDVIKEMADLGFQVAGFRRPVTRTARGPYGLHEIDFRLPGDIAKPADLVPRILFLNSYDGSKKAQLIAGIFRLVCANGLVAGNPSHQEKIIHVGDFARSLANRLREVGEETRMIMDKAREFSEIILSPGQVLEFAEEGRRLRDPEGLIDISPKVLALPRRREDVRDDLWTVFNRVQENLIKGGLPIRNAKGKVTDLRGVNHIQASNKLNGDLWELMEQYAQE